ncbi:MAG: DUF2271 domain-containing protein [Bacteroidota bacterium]
MKELLKYILPIAALLFLASFALLPKEADSGKYKCMVQLTNYQGEGAYIIVSAMNGKNEYIKTLRVLGDDEEWYPDLPEWWAFHTKNDKPNIDGITGATIAGGERSIFILEVDKELVDAGNTLRFETAVEDQDYHPKDLQVPLTTKTLMGKFEGNGYIRYVRMIANK